MSPPFWMPCVTPWFTTMRMLSACDAFASRSALNNVPTRMSSVRGS